MNSHLGQCHINPIVKEANLFVLYHWNFPNHGASYSQSCKCAPLWFHHAQTSYIARIIYWILKKNCQ
jgi:hypothetical protein